MSNTANAADGAANSKGTVVTGTIGDDVHVIGLRIMEYALRQNGFTVVTLGPLAQKKEFIDAAIETAADALFVSSLNGHAELHIPGLRDADSGRERKAFFASGDALFDPTSKRWFAASIAALPWP